MNRTHGSAERGFMLIEVIIAAILLAVVVSAIAFAALTGSHSSTANRSRSSMRDIADTTLERLKADRGWTTGACAATAIDAVCSLPASILPTSERELNDVAYDLVISVIPRDRGADGVGSRDTDGVLRDDWDISIMVSPIASDAARIGNPTPLNITGSLLAERSKQGGLVVQYCSASFQRDERIEFAACDTQQDFVLPNCPTTDENCEARSRTIAFLPSANPSGQVRVVSVRPLNFTLNGLGISRTRNDAVPIDAAGNAVPLALATAFRFENLPPGAYTLTQSAGDVAPYVVWRNHSIPSSGRVNVQDGELSRAMVALHQPDTAQPMRINFRRLTWDRTWVGDTVAVDDGWSGSGCLGATPDIRDGILWYRYTGCSLTGAFTYVQYVWGPGSMDGNGNPCGNTIRYSFSARWVSCWLTSAQQLLTTEYQASFRWRYIRRSSTVLNNWAGSSGSTSVTLTPNPLGRAVRVNGPASGLATGYSSLESIPTSVQRVGSPGGVSSAARWNQTNVSGRSMMMVTPRTRGLHAREVANLDDPSQRANVGDRAVVAGGTSANGECERLVWVRPLTGNVGCQLTYTGRGECYDRLNGAPGSYGWRVFPCAGNDEPQDCVRFRGANRCGMGVLLYETCYKMDVQYSNSFFGTDLGASNPTTGGSSSGGGWTCRNQLDVCADTSFSCSAGRTICAPGRPSINGLPNGRGQYPGVPTVCRNP